MANVADVVTAVRWAIESGISVTAQPSGHAPRTTLDDTLLLRTRALRGIAVDVEERTAVVGAGVKWGELMRELDDTGLIALCGSNPDPSVVGLLLGGGVSWFTRAHGFTANSVLSVDLVNPEGELVHVTQESDPELFWALRGGGGDFGIVVRVEIRLFPAPELYGGQLLWSIEDAPKVLKAFRDLSLVAPRELTMWAHILHITCGIPAAISCTSSTVAAFAIAGSLGGDASLGERSVRPIGRQIGRKLPVGLGASSRPRRCGRSTCPAAGASANRIDRGIGGSITAIS